VKAPARLVAVLAGGSALAWAGILLFFTAKDSPYEIGWVFDALGLGGMILGAALFVPVLVSGVRGRSDLPFTRCMICACACLLASLLGWSGALAMYYTSAMPGSVFMLWALVSGIAGLLAPLPIAAFARRRERIPSRPRPVEGAAVKKRASTRWLLFVAAGVPGAMAVILFARFGDFGPGGFFTSILPVVIGAASAIALPVLLALISRFHDRTRRLVVGLLIWFFGTAALVGVMLAAWVVYELVVGLMHFRL
jgi:hypothetical protein